MILIEEYMKRNKEERQKHLDLTSECIIRGTNSVQCRGLLAHFLGTTVPNGNKIILCHACNNGKCSNYKHLYWGTASENAIDRNEYHKSLGNDLYKSYSDYIIPPWFTNGTSDKNMKDWVQADKIYLELQTSKDYYSHRKLCKVFGINIGPARNMSKMFKEGWIPRNDLDWMFLYKNYELVNRNKELKKLWHIHKQGSRRICPVCGNVKKAKNKTCSHKCSRNTNSKVDWSLWDYKLDMMYKNMSLTHIAKEIGISDNGVRKRMKKLGIIK